MKVFKAQKCKFSKFTVCKRNLVIDVGERLMYIKLYYELCKFLKFTCVSVQSSKFANNVVVEVGTHGISKSHWLTIYITK